MTRTIRQPPNQQRREERPMRRFGIRNSKSPAVVVRIRARRLLRCALRSAERSCGAAPIASVSSASINFGRRFRRLGEDAHQHRRP
jgi:hypothetical protein